MPWEQDEDVVDRLLRRLGDQPSPAGMEARIVDALRKKEFPRPWQRTWWPALAAAMLVCGVAVAILFAATRQRAAMPHRAGSFAPRSLPHAEAAEPAPPRVFAAEQGASVMPRPGRRHDAAPLRRHAAALVPAYRAASFPAPPRPLTRQERLLLIVARQRDPAAEAMLNQHAQTEEMARNRAAFEAYFYRPTEEEMEKHAQQN